MKDRDTKPRHKGPPTPRQRLFTKEFELGDHVYVVREEHGWHDGALDGYVVSMTDMFCVVFNEESGCAYGINHPRDIHKSYMQLGPNRRHQIVAKYKASTESSRY